VTGLTRRATEVARAAAQRRDLRSRQPPDLRVGHRSGPSTVYYLAPHFDAPSGGVRLIYRHVDLLNALGIPAAVIHARRGFRCTWFENSTRVLSSDEVRLGPDDVLVAPEWYAAGFDRLPTDVRVVVFNQGAYHSFDRIAPGEGLPGAPYTTLPSLAAMICVSQDNRALLGLALPGIPVSVCRPVVDGRLFRPDGQPARQLGYVVARRPIEARLLEHVLLAQQVDWPVVRLRGLSEAELARSLRECAVFVSLSDLDGFGLPPAEAMASGCFVVGYSGGGGEELFDPRWSEQVTSFRGLAEATLRAARTPVDELAARGRLASEHVLGYYTAEGLSSDLETAFSGLVS
jgi:hypothetical protein